MIEFYTSPDDCLTNGVSKVFLNPSAISDPRKRDTKEGSLGHELPSQTDPVNLFNFSSRLPKVTLSPTEIARLRTNWVRSIEHLRDEEISSFFPGDQPRYTHAHTYVRLTHTHRLNSFLPLSMADTAYRFRDENRGLEYDAILRNSIESRNKLRITRVRCARESCVEF